MRDCEVQTSRGANRVGQRGTEYLLFYNAFLLLSNMLYPTVMKRVGVVMREEEMKSSVHRSAIQYSTVKCTTVQYSEVQCNTMQCCAVTGTRRSITCHQDNGKHTCVSFPSCSFLKQDPSVSSTGPGFTPEGPDMDPSWEKEVVEEERRETQSRRLRIKSREK